MTDATTVVAASDRDPLRRLRGRLCLVERHYEYFYKPALVTVAAGQKVTFVNVGKISHTVADSTRSGTILSRLIKPHELKPGARQTISLSKPGVVYYLCTFHPTLMHGKIIVR